MFGTPKDVGRIQGMCILSGILFHIRLDTYLYGCARMYSHLPLEMDIQFQMEFSYIYYNQPIAVPKDTLE